MKFWYLLAVMLLVSCVSSVGDNSSYTKSEVDCRVLYLNGKILDMQVASVGDVRYNIESEGAGVL